MMWEVIDVLNWMLWISGIILWIGVPMLWMLNHMCDKIDQVSLRLTDGDAYPTTNTFANTTAIDTNLSTKTIVELLDMTLEPSAQLNRIYYILCQRAGVTPNSLCPMADLISEAVFDGQRREQCIYELDLIDASVLPETNPLERTHHHA